MAQKDIDNVMSAQKANTLTPSLTLPGWHLPLWATSLGDRLGWSAGCG